MEGTSEGWVGRMGVLMVLLEPVQAVVLPELEAQMVVFFSTTLVTTASLVVVGLVVWLLCDVVEGAGLDVAA